MNNKSPFQWLVDNSGYFSRELNGYTRPPIGPYLSTLPLIDRDGKIIDFGSGNGMLLKFLMLFSKHKLEPFGIDVNPQAIKQAAEEVLPGYANNFCVEDVNLYNFKESPFDIIITNPFYAHKKMREFTEKCLYHLNHGGRLIYRIHDDVLSAHKIDRLEELPEFHNLGMRVSNGDGLMFCVFDK